MTGPQNIYDNPAFFEGYSQLQRSKLGLPAGAPEWASLQAMLPSLEGLRVLDLGCGFGYFSRWARQAGAATVLGVDLSENMLARARSETKDPAIAFLRADIEHLDLPFASLDLIFSSLAIHYVADLPTLLAAMRKWLTPGGRLVFSVEHPIYSAPVQQGWQSDASGARTWPLRSYLFEGQRITEWITPGVVKYHRVVATYINGLLASGFQLLRIEEWGPSEAQLREHPEWVDEKHRPPFLLVSALRT